MRKYLLLLFILAAATAFSQEVLTGLQFNRLVHNRTTATVLPRSAAYLTDTVPMSLPLFDDFSKSSIFPDSTRWIDRYAFVNTDYPVYPVNLGVATLDAINDSGLIYSQATPGPATFIADHLTSRYIRLDSVFTPVPRALTPADSVYLSFFYQPQGLGLEPEGTDSLVLQFLVQPAHDSISPTDTTFIPDRWRKAWVSKGMALDTFYLLFNRYNGQVMIPITDPVFFTNKFRFQFYNYVSLATALQPSWQSNTDQWNLDNIYLNLGRSYKDTLIPELRFLMPAPSMLKNYQSMPYPQYSDSPSNEIADSLYILMSNRDTITRKASYKYSITSDDGGFNKVYDGGTDSIRPVYKYGYVTYPPFAHPPVPYLLPTSAADSAEFRVSHVLKDLTPGSTLGDTIERVQGFYNYYAYDDGTPETGYGINGTGSLMALRFKLNKSPDTLRGVYIFFDRTLENMTSTETIYFYLTVWNDNNGKPGDTLYSRLTSLKFSDALNGFVGYRLEVPVRIPGTFYVGTIQTTSDNLNIGFDRNHNARENLFFNSFGTWVNSSFDGALMLRPIIGKPIKLGIPDNGTSTLQATVYPNPCNGDRVRIELPGSAAVMEATVFNLIGKELLRTATEGDLDVSGLSQGLYILRIRDTHSGQTATAKLLITR